MNSFGRIFQIAILFLLLFNCSQDSYSQQRDKSFDAYWTKFRDAVINRNDSVLKSLTQFPLIVKGTMDFDPIKKFNKDKFTFIFDHYLKQGITKDDILETIAVPDKVYMGENQDVHRISDMVFKKINRQWKLSLIYIETSYQEENNIK